MTADRVYAVAAMQSVELILRVQRDAQLSDAQTVRLLHLYRNAMRSQRRKGFVGRGMLERALARALDRMAADEDDCRTV